MATLSKRGDYCGEFTLLVGEPRAASLRAAETTCLWALHEELLLFWISKLPPAVQLEAREVADSRRRSNLYKLYPLTPKLIHEVPMFQMWSEDSCESLASKCKPAVFKAGEVMVREVCAPALLHGPHCLPCPLTPLPLPLPPPPPPPSLLHSFNSQSGRGGGGQAPTFLKEPTQKPGRARVPQSGSHWHSRGYGYSAQPSRCQWCRGWSKGEGEGMAAAVNAVHAR